MSGVKSIKKILLCFFLTAVFFSPTGCSSAAQIQKTGYGAGMFFLPEKTGADNEKMKVFYYRPVQWDSGKPAMIVQHGVQRNAEEYRDELIKCAEQYDVLIVCPEFSRREYPGGRYYNLGNMADGSSPEQIQPKKQWVFSVISDVIGEIGRRFDPHGQIVLFGHSAGAQFVHRYMLFADKDKRISQIIIANAGWYTMPDDKASFPYGIKNIPMDKNNLAADFSEPVILLLGEDDIHSDRSILRHTKQADAQGSNRFERGIKFFNEGEQAARKLNVPFKWRLVTVPGVGHDDLKMAAAAAALISK